MMLVSKTPAERRSVDIDISDDIGSESGVTGVEAVVAARHGAQKSVLTCSAEALPAGARLELAAGMDGRVYRIDLTFTLADGQILERAVEVHVLDLDFILPDTDKTGTGRLHSYIAPAAYRDRFGLEELLLLTSDPHVTPPRVNRDRFMAALKDATAEIDAVLAARYRVPALNPPDILMTHAATLTREILHRYADTIPEHIAEAAKGARADLRRLATTGSGLTGLQARTAATSGMPEFEAGDAHFSSDKLKVF